MTPKPLNYKKDTWLKQAQAKVSAVLDRRKDDDEVVAYPGTPAYFRTLGLLADIQQYSGAVTLLSLPGVTVDDIVIDLSWGADGNKVEFLVSDDALRITFWDGKQSLPIEQTKAFKLIEQFHNQHAVA